MAQEIKSDERYGADAKPVPRNQPLHYLITDQFRYELMAATNNVDIKERLRVYPPVTPQALQDLGYTKVAP